MKDYIKQIKKNYRNNGIWLGIGLGLLIALFPSLIATFIPLAKSWIAGIIVFVVIILLVMIITMIVRHKQFKNIHNRVEILEASGRPLNQEHFEAIAEEMSIGEHWLVYHRGLQYLFWTKDSIQKVRRINDRLLEITNHENCREKCRVTTNIDLESVIANWITPNADNLTFHQTTL